MWISRKSRELQNEIAASYLDDLINSLVTKVSGMQSTCIEMPKNLLLIDLNIFALF